MLGKKERPPLLEPLPPDGEITDSHRPRPSDPQNAGRGYRGAPVKKNYYVGSITRRDAEGLLLRSQNFDGTFLVRDSEKQLPEGIPTYAISLLNNGIVFHVEIKTNDQGRYIIPEMDSKSFGSVETLVGYYQKEPLGLEGGCSVKLKYYIPNSVSA